MGQRSRLSPKAIYAIGEDKTAICCSAGLMVCSQFRNNLQTVIPERLGHSAAKIYAAIFQRGLQD